MGEQQRRWRALVAILCVLPPAARRRQEGRLHRRRCSTSEPESGSVDPAADESQRHENSPTRPRAGKTAAAATVNGATCAVTRRSSILWLASSFVADKWRAFGGSPSVFETHLVLGSRRVAVSMAVAHWRSRRRHGPNDRRVRRFRQGAVLLNESVLPLCTRERIDADYKSMNSTTVLDKAGKGCVPRFLGLLQAFSAPRR